MDENRDVHLVHEVTERTTPAGLVQRHVVVVYKGPPQGCSLLPQSTQDQLKTVLAPENPQRVGDAGKPRTVLLVVGSPGTLFGLGVTAVGIIAVQDTESISSIKLLGLALDTTSGAVAVTVTGAFMTFGFLALVVRRLRR